MCLRELHHRISLRQIELKMLHYYSTKDLTTREVKDYLEKTILDYLEKSNRKRITIWKNSGMDFCTNKSSVLTRKKYFGGTKHYLMEKIYSGRTASLDTKRNKLEDIDPYYDEYDHSKKHCSSDKSWTNSHPVTSAFLDPPSNHLKLSFPKRSSWFDLLLQIVFPCFSF